jgi:peptidoglycan/LPS O-acetylase OafA/YrhL
MNGAAIVLPSRNKLERLKGIDALRAYAAFSIIIFHLTFAPGITVSSTFATIRNYLGFGVPLFFVISAFSIAHGYLHRPITEGVVKTFYLRRWVRIAPLFYLVLAYQLVVLWIQYSIFPGWPAVFASLSLAFNFVPEWVDGIVPASWSIGVEFIFYALFPLLALAARRSLTLLSITVVAVVVSASAYKELLKAKELNESFIYHHWLNCLPYFLAGLFGYRLYEWVGLFIPASLTRRRKSFGIILAIFGIGLIFLLARTSSIYLYFWQYGLRSVWDWLWGIAFLLLSARMAIHPWSLLSNPVTAFLGRISFSLYLLHPHIVHGLGELGLYKRISIEIPNRDIAVLVSFLVSSTIVVALSAVTYRWIELPGMKLGRISDAANSNVDNSSRS